MRRKREWISKHARADRPGNNDDGVIEVAASKGRGERRIGPPLVSEGSNETQRSMVLRCL